MTPIIPVGRMQALRLKVPTGPCRGLLWVTLLLALCLGGSASWAGEEYRSEDQRFIDHGDQTITDTRSGLMWQKTDSYLHIGHWLNWEEAFAYVHTLNEDGFGGHYDWRMPALEELRTLHEADKVNSRQLGREMVIHMDPIFSKKGAGAQWSKDTNGHFNAFGINFNTGMRFSAQKKSRSRKSARAVRNVSPAPGAP